MSLPPSRSHRLATIPQILGQGGAILLAHSPPGLRHHRNCGRDDLRGYPIEIPACRVELCPSQPALIHNDLVDIRKPCGGEVRDRPLRAPREKSVVIERINQMGRMVGIEKLLLGTDHPPVEHRQKGKPWSVLRLLNIPKPLTPGAIRYKPASMR